MSKLITINDISRNDIAAVWPIIQPSDDRVRRRLQANFELLVIMELLRATPRFWDSVHAIAFPTGAPGWDGLHRSIRSPQGLPHTATAGRRFAAVALRLHVAMGRGWTQLDVRAARVAPRTWAYEFTYDWSDRTTMRPRTPRR